MNKKQQAAYGSLGGKKTLAKKGRKHFVSMAKKMHANKLKKMSEETNVPATPTPGDVLTPAGAAEVAA